MELKWLRGRDIHLFELEFKLCCVEEEFEDEFWVVSTLQGDLRLQLATLLAAVWAWSTEHLL